MEKLVSIKNARKAISQANEGVVERSRRIYVRGSRNDLRVLISKREMATRNG